MIMMFKSSPFKMVNVSNGILSFDAEGALATNDADHIKTLKRLSDVDELVGKAVKPKPDATVKTEEV